MARILATHLGEALDGTVVIENKPGAGGNIGIGIAAHAEPGRHVPGVSRTCENAVDDRRAVIGRPV
jgi:tripartite-type tricarboxylate transporter receptor subunit TctC